MEYRALGSSGLKVSTLCLGTMTFGEADENSFMHKVGCDEGTAHAIMSRALDAGVSFFDTADVYGQDGLTERVIGSWFAASKQRERVVLATKFRFKMNPGPNGSGGSRLRIVRAAEASLKRLGTDRIDLYQIHMQDIETPEEETLRALDDLVRAGKVLYIGCSNYAAYRMADALALSRAQGLERYATLQASYSLVVRDLEREHLPLCRAHGVGILPYSPLAGGFLSGKYRKDEPPPPGARLERWKERLTGFDNERNWRILDALAGAAREVSATPSQVAMAWLLSRAEVSSVIFGARSVEQLDENLRAGEVKLSTDMVKRLDQASAFPLGYPYEFLQRVQGRW